MSKILNATERLRIDTCTRQGNGLLKRHFGGCIVLLFVEKLQWVPGDSKGDVKYFL